MRSWTSVRDAIRSAPGASPPFLGGRTGRDKCDACVDNGQTKSLLGESFWCKVCPHPHLEQGRTPLVKRWRWLLFSLLQIRANNSSLTPLNCILKNWNRFNPPGLKKTHLVFLCDTAWLQYPVEDSEWWPVEGSFEYKILFYS